jgi:hypothetical protein
MLKIMNTVFVRSAAKRQKDGAHAVMSSTDLMNISDLSGKSIKRSTKK